MKLTLFSFVLCFSLSSLFAQNYSTDFLDGTVMFQLSDETTNFDPYQIQRDKHDFGLALNLSDYPELQ